MNYRLNTPLIIIVGCIVVAAAGLFGYTMYTNKYQGSEEATTTVQNVDDLQVAPEIITAQHQFKNGKHVIAGELSLPTPCHTLTAEPFFIGQGSSTVEVRFNTSAPQSTSTVCAQVVTAKKFQVTFDGPPKPSITAQINNNPAQFNFIEVPANQKLEGVSDEYFKG
jgi:hypothetical protein